MSGVMSSLYTLFEDWALERYKYKHMYISYKKQFVKNHYHKMYEYFPPPFQDCFLFHINEEHCMDLMVVGIPFHCTSINEEQNGLK